MKYNTIKQVTPTYLKLNDIPYKGYAVCNIPNRFGFIDNGDTEGFYEWFNYKGLTWLQVSKMD